MTTAFAQIPLAHITASPNNPRKTFDATKLAELAESIRASGVHQPILVRPLPGHRVADTDRAVQYEIVTGKLTGHVQSFHVTELKVLPS